MDFVGLLKQSAAPEWSKGSVLVLLRDNFEISTWLLFGAALQSALFLIVGRLAVTPVLAFALYKLGTTYAIKTGLIANPYMQGVLETKFSAQIPDEQGNYGNKPANKDVCVFIIGAKVNSPLGFLEKDVKQFGDYFTRMTKELEARSDEFGFLGSTTWIGAERGSGNSTMALMYFKSHEGVHAHAHSALHREGWNWYNKELLSRGCVSIYHELYQVPSGNYETIYGNMAPSGLAATMHRVQREGEKEARWMSPIVDARKGLLKTSRGRMSRSGAHEHDGYENMDAYGSVSEKR